MKLIHANCAFCGKPVVRRVQSKSANVKRHFCSMKCKAAFQRLAKPVTREWLYEQYVTLGRDCPDIAREVKRDAKSVWNWLKDFGIPTRPRGQQPDGSGNGWNPQSGKPNPFRGRKHSLTTIAKLKGRKVSQATRETLRAIAIADERVPFDKKVGPNGGRRGADHPCWKGGITAERQAFYATSAWKKAARVVWNRDKRTCQRCGKVHSRGEPFDIHHIVSFECVALRATVSNLVLLCESCHYWVHGRRNIKRRFILPCP